MAAIENSGQLEASYSTKIERQSLRTKSRLASTLGMPLDSQGPIIKPYQVAVKSKAAVVDQTALPKSKKAAATESTGISIPDKPLAVTPEEKNSPVQPALVDNLETKKQTLTPVTINVKSETAPDKPLQAAAELREVKKSEMQAKLAAPKPQPKLAYEVSVGFTKEEITGFLKASFNLKGLALSEARLSEIISKTLVKKEVNKEDFYAFVISDLTTIPQVLAKIPNLTKEETQILGEFFPELYKNQPIMDTQNLINSIKNQFKPEIVKNLKEKDFLKFRSQVEAKLTWAYQNLDLAKGKKSASQPNEAIFTNVVDLFEEKRSELIVFALEDLKKEINTALYENVPELYKVALDRLDVIKGKNESLKVTTFKDDDLEVALSKKQALLSNKSSGVTARLTFGDFEETLPPSTKISFHEDDAKLKESLQAMGIDLKEYATISKIMPEIRYMNNDEDIPDTVIARKFYDSITDLFKNQRNLPPGYHKHLENIKKYADTGDLAFKAACKMSIVVNTIYAVLRVIGVASVLLFGTGNTSLLDQIGSIGLFIGEFAVRVPASLQYNHIIYQTLATDNEKYNITQKELDEVRGENGPPLGMLHYFYKEGFIFNGTIETTFLTSTGYWNFTSHNYGIGWSEGDVQKQDGNKFKLKSWENEKEKFLGFINNLNKEVKENWLKFENTLAKTKKSTAETFNEALSINTAKDLSGYSEADLDLVKEETARIAKLYQELNRNYLLKEDFWRSRTKEYSRSKSMNVMWYSKIADTWGAHGKIFLNRIKENEFALSEIMNSEEPKKSQLIKHYLEGLRAQYRKLEHSYHHKIIIDYSQAYHKMNFENFSLVNEKFQAGLTEDTKRTKVADLIKNQVAIKKFTLKVNELLDLFNRDLIISNVKNNTQVNVAVEKISKALEKYMAGNKALTVNDVLPQLILDYFSYLSYDSGGKPQAQNRIYERFGKTFYMARINSAKNSDGAMIIEFTEEQFNKFLKTYLDKEGFTEKEWDLLSDEDWSKLGTIAKLFPKKPERRAWPKTRFNYSMDKDYVPTSINPVSGQQEDASAMVAYLMRLQKRGEVNVPVLQSKQTYLYDNEYEYLPQAANDDQKPWYGGFVFLGMVENLYNKVQEIHKFLPENAKAQGFAKVLYELAFWIKEQDKYHTMKLWPAITEVLVQHSDKGLTEADLDELIKNQEKTRPEVVNKLTYPLLDKWLSNLYVVLLDQRKKAGMAVGKDADNAMFNCGTCRVEDIQLHRLAYPRYQIMNPTKHGGDLTNHHSLVVVSNETGDIQKYLVRESNIQASMQQSINPLVDLNCKKEEDLLHVVKTLFIDTNFPQYKNEALTLKKDAYDIEIYDSRGKRILADYVIRITNHEEHLAEDKNRSKLVIQKAYINQEGKPVISDTPEKIIYQYYQNFSISQGELEEIFGIQETRPIQEADVFSRNTIGLRKKTAGVFKIKEGFLTTFTFDEAIQRESDIDLLDYEPEVKSKVKDLFRKYKRNESEVGTVVIDYTPTGKIVTDFVPYLKNTRYVSYVTKESAKDIITHTAGTIDLSSSQILEQLTQMGNNTKKQINFAGGNITIIKENSNYQVEINRKNNTKDTYLVKPGENSYILLHNNTESERFALDENKGASLTYHGFSGVMRSLANKLKQVLAEEDFEIDYGYHEIDSKTFNDVFSNPSLFNRTITLNNLTTATLNGRGNYNLSFNMGDFALKQNPADDNKFLFELLATAAKVAIKEPVQSNSFAHTESGFLKKGAKWQNIILKEGNELKHDLRISMVEKKGIEFIWVQDMVTEESVYLPFIKGNSAKEAALISRDQQTSIKKLQDWFSNKEVQIIDLPEPALRRTLKLQFGSNKIDIKKSRDRSNLSLMLLNIKELAPSGKFTFKKKVNDQEKTYKLEFHLDQVKVNDVKFSSYEGAIKALDSLLFASAGDVTIESEVLMPRLVSKMVKTDENGKVLVEEDLSCPRETMPDWWITEDAASTWEQHRRGFQIRYAPYSFSDGVGPETMNEMVQQHKRWALGTMNSFKAEELKKIPVFAKSLPGKQLKQNENWYKHGWYDEPLYDCPVALANSFLAFQNFNPMAVDKLPFGEFPITSVIVGVGLLATFLNIITYYLDMKRQKTSIKDIFIKESLIGFLGSNSYVMAHEHHVAGTENKFDVTSIGGPRERIPYEAIKETNTRLAKSLYSTAMFSGFYLSTMIAGGLAGFVSPIAFTSALVGFWSALNTAKLLTGIGAFDGFKNYFDDFKEGFLLDAENKSMEVHNERAAAFGSIDNLEKVLAIGQQRIRGRIANGEREAIKTENYGNFSLAIDTALHRLNSDELSKEGITDTIRLLDVVSKIYSEIGQQKAGIQLLKRVLYPKRLYIEDLQQLIMDKAYASQLKLKDIKNEINQALLQKLQSKKFNPDVSLLELAELDNNLYKELVKEISYSLNRILVNDGVISKENDALKLFLNADLTGILAPLTETVNQRLSAPIFNSIAELTSINAGLANYSDPKGKTLLLANGRARILSEVIVNIRNQNSTFVDTILSSPKLHMDLGRAYLKDGFLDEALYEIKRALFFINEVADANERIYLYQLAEWLLVLTMHESAKRNLKSDTYYFDEIKVLNDVVFKGIPVIAVLNQETNIYKERLLDKLNGLYSKINEQKLNAKEFSEQTIALFKMLIQLDFSGEAKTFIDSILAKKIDLAKIDEKKIKAILSQNISAEEKFRSLFKIIFNQELDSNIFNIQGLSFNPEIMATRFRPLYQLEVAKSNFYDKLPITSRINNIKHFNQASILFDVYQKTKQKEHLLEAYKHYARVSEKSVDMELIGNEILLTLMKIYKDDPQFKERLTKDHLTEINSLLDGFQAMDNIKFPNSLRDETYLPNISFPTDAVASRLDEELKDLAHLLMLLSKGTALKNKKNLASVSEFLNSQEFEEALSGYSNNKANKFRKVKIELLYLLEKNKMFLPDLRLIELDYKGNFDCQLVSRQMKVLMKERYSELQGLINSLTTILPYNSRLTLVPIEDQRGNIKVRLDVSAAITKESHYDSYLVKMVAPQLTAKDFNTEKENEIWAKDASACEDDLYLRQQKLMLRRLMVLTGVAVEGVNKGAEEDLAKNYAVQANGLAKVSLVRSDLESVAKKQVKKVVLNIVKRLIETNRYDEALRFYSYFITTLKLEGKIFEPKNIAEFIEANFGKVDEEEQKDHLKQYADFLGKYGAKLTMDQKKNVLAFKKISKEKVKNIVTEKVINQRSVKNEVDRVQNLIANFMGEICGHQEISKVQKEIEANQKKLVLENLSKNSNIQNFREYLSLEKDLNLVNEIFAYLFANKDLKVEGNLKSIALELKSKLTFKNKLELLNLYYALTFKAAKGFNELKANLEAFFDTILKTATQTNSLNKPDQEELELLINKYLGLWVFKADVNFESVILIYQKILKKDPSESVFFEKLANSFQSYFEDRSIIELLKLKDQKVDAKNKKEFEGLFSQLIIYINYLIKGEVVNAFALEKNTKDLLAVANLAKKVHLNTSKILSILNELVKLADYYELDLKSKTILFKTFDLLINKFQDQSEKSFGFQLFSMNAAALLDNSKMIESKYYELLRKVDTLPLPDNKKQWFKKELLFNLTIAAERIINSATASNEEKIKITAFAISKLNEQALNFMGNEFLSWDIEFLRLELRLKVTDLIAANKIPLQEVRPLMIEGNGFSKSAIIQDITSSLVYFSKKITDTENAILDNSRKLNITNDHFFNLSHKENIAAYRKLKDRLLELIKNYKFFTNYETNESDALSSEQKQALRFILRNAPALQTGIGINKKVMALKGDQAFFRSEAVKGHGFNENALVSDKEKVTAIYNGANPRINAADEKEENSTTKVGLKVRQKVSAAKQELKKFNHKLTNHPIYLLMKKIIGPALIYGSFGLLVAGILSMAYPPAGIALGGTVFLYLVCFAGGAVVFPILQKILTKLFWAIYSTLKGRSAKRLMQNNLVE